MRHAGAWAFLPLDAPSSLSKEIISWRRTGVLQTAAQQPVIGSSFEPESFPGDVHPVCRRQCDNLEKVARGPGTPEETPGARGRLLLLSADQPLVAVPGCPRGSGRQQRERARAP